MTDKTRTTAASADERPRRIVGTAALYSGVGLLGLLLIHATYGLSWSMPASWYRDQPLWGGLSFLLIGIGWRLLRKRRPQPTAWKPARPGRRFNNVTLYTRSGCHLCDAALAVLEEYRSYLPPVEEVDIDGDPQLQERFDTCVPVVEVDGKVRFRGKIDEVLLRRLIEGAPPHTQQAAV